MLVKVSDDMDIFDNAFGEPGEVIPEYPLDIAELRRRVESRPPEEVACIVAEVDELVAGSKECKEL